MNFKGVTLATLIGLAVPAIATVSDTPSMVAQTSYPSGTFEDSVWSVTINYSNNVLSYEGKNKQNGNNLSLRGAKVGGDAQRRVYTWVNGDTTYQVAWRPSDPNFIRVQVFDSKGKETLNRLLKKS
ncbi:hypothetical protein [Gloeothece verrucosa]|uniref:Uncharacterized protein n=1 Tax=Gloeothece verrucosa (strain PCC 7822) TaxID=497965 RepID=E0UFP0_GLOV7|nr:hypothetical protein [Gloeothece verrucosa]ADN13151.1 hypothetical protein Cyan7822_1144 [Gloeothece verrucosa PCC 7822]